MTIRKWIANNFLSLVIIILGAIIIFQNVTNVTGTNNYYSDTTVHKSEIYYGGDTTIIKPVVRDSVVTVFNTETISQKSDSQLIAMVKDLKEELLKVRKYKDTFKVDTIGTATLEQEVTQNMISKQKMTYDLRIPKYDTLITKYVPHKNIWMIGGSIDGAKGDVVRQINADLLLITKKDKGYKIGTGIDLNGRVVYRFGLYWKL